MIYQPRNVQPSGVSIDGLLDNTFTMEIQTNSYVSAYQLLIVDFDNNEIYTGSKTTLTNYAYNGDTLEIPVNASTVALSNGTNYKWRVRLYQPTADMLITYGLVQATSTTTTIYLQPNINIKAGMAITINSQTKTISSYNSDTGVAVVSSAFSSAPAVGTQYKIYSDFIETVPDYIVYARRTPAVAISNVPSSLTLKYHTFQGTYTQSDNVAIVYHQFDLYTRNDDGTISLVASSDKVYSANLSYTYDSFRTGNKYLIQMTVENDMGIISTTDMYEFTVSYDIVEYLQQPLASFDDKNNAVKVSWVTPVENEAVSNNSGAASGTIQDGANSLTQAVFEDNQTLGNGDQVQITANSVGKNKLTEQTDTNTNAEFYKSNGFEVKAGTTYTLSCNTRCSGIYVNRKADNEWIAYTYSKKTLTFTPSEDTLVWFNFYFAADVDEKSTQYQLEENSVATTYEPYRSIGTRYTGVINSYNATTGVGTMLADYPFTYTPMPGDTYQVLSNIYNNTGFQYLYNTPYNTVNSLYTHGYTATWSTPDGLCVLPDDFNITLQFSPDGNFFYDQDGVYQEVVDIITTETDDINNKGEFTIRIDKNKLIFAQQSEDGGNIVWDGNTEGKISAQGMLYKLSDITPSKEDLIGNKLTLTSPDEVKTFNIVAEDDGVSSDICYPIDLDDSGNYAIATLLPVVAVITTPTSTYPSTGIYFLYYDGMYVSELGLGSMVLETPFYTNTSQVFVLSSANIAQINNDYVWDDTATWTDTYTWVEGGTSLERVCNHWWKVQITNTGIKIEEIFPTT